MCLHMTSKNISITKDVYNKLLKIKLENESFSELFLRLLKIQKNTLNETLWYANLKKFVRVIVFLNFGKTVQGFSHNVLHF